MITCRKKSLNRLYCERCRLNVRHPEVTSPRRFAHESSGFAQPGRCGSLLTAYISFRKMRGMRLTSSHLFSFSATPANKIAFQDVPCARFPVVLPCWLLYRRRFSLAQPCPQSAAPENSHLCIPAPRPCLSHASSQFAAHQAAALSNAARRRHRDGAVSLTLLPPRSRRGVGDRDIATSGGLDHGSRAGADSTAASNLQFPATLGHKASAFTGYVHMHGAK